MSDTCPTCGQTLPQQTGRICAVCHKPIGRHHRYQNIGGKTVHRDCSNPTQKPIAQEKISSQRSLLGDGTL